MLDIKICSKCKIAKPVSEFAKRPDRKSGLQSACKACKKLYRVANKEKIKSKNKNYYEKNKEEILEKNRPKNKKYHKSHKGEISVRKKEYYVENREAILAYKKANRLVSNKRERIKRETDVVYRLRRNVSCIVFNMLKRHGSSKNGMSVLKHLTYTIQELREHLEKQFEPWMSWDNWGKYSHGKWNDNDPATWTWQIDHIIPQHLLPYNSMTDDNFRKCWSLSNLRPYSAKLNVIDGATKIKNRNP